jgi:hypothetical protein
MDVRELFPCYHGSVAITKKVWEFMKNYDDINV